MVYMSCGWVFHNISLAAGHHHPNIWHEGDAIPDSIDWGLFQVMAVGDRPDVDQNLYLSTVSYGIHLLHHLFPTVDHSRLHLLQDALKQTCKEFIITVPTDSKLQATLGAVASTTEEKDIAATKTFMSRRVLNAADGWLGMMKQVFY